jgi:hypothetical protein
LVVRWCRSRVLLFQRLRGALLWVPSEEARLPQVAFGQRTR